MKQADSINIKVLGSGTSGGVPVITCGCEVCLSTNPKDKRLRCSIHLEHQGAHLNIDAGPDFRMQMLTADIQHLDAILITHEHRDHVGGLDDIRYYCNKQKQALPIYGNKKALHDIQAQYPYAFGEQPYRGGPRMDLRLLETASFEFKGLPIQTITASHGQTQSFGYRLKNFAYLTDFHAIEKAELEKLRGLDVLIMGALRQHAHVSHLSLPQAMELVEELQPKQTYFTHISHEMGLHDKVEATLPNGVHLAYDGLELEV